CEPSALNSTHLTPSRKGSGRTNGPRAGTSQSLARASDDQVRNCGPCGRKAPPSTKSAQASGSLNASPRWVLHSRALPSSLTDKMSEPSTPNTAELTCLLCGSSKRSFASCAFHRRALASEQAVSTVFPSGLNRAEVTRAG